MVQSGKLSEWNGIIMQFDGDAVCQEGLRAPGYVFMNVSQTR
jgi:hypothetical protein